MDDVEVRVEELPKLLAEEKRVEEKITLVDDLIDVPPQEFLSLDLMLKVADLSSSSR